MKEHLAVVGAPAARGPNSLPVRAVDLMKRAVILCGAGDAGAMKLTYGEFLCASRPERKTLQATQVESGMKEDLDGAVCVLRARRQRHQP